MYSYIIISAILTALSFTFDEASYLIWISLSPYIFVIMNSKINIKNSYKYGFVFGSVFYGIILYWLFELYPFDWLGFNNVESFLIIFFGWLIFSAIQGGIIGFVPVIFKFIKSENDYINIISMGFSWIIIEWMQGKGELGFTWGRLAISQGLNTKFIQGASIFGCLFISFLIIIINGLIMLSFKIKKNKPIIIALIIFGINFIYGSIRVKEIGSENFCNVSVIQGNIDFSDKWKLSKSQLLEKYKSISNTAISEWNEVGEKVDILIWPETAVPVTVNKFKNIADEYVDISKQNDLVFIVGGFYCEELDEKDVYYNSAYTIDGGEFIFPHYSKKKLVPFGEKIPFKNQILRLFPFFEKGELFENDITIGKELGLKNTRIGKLGILICYESIFQDISREIVNRGAEGLIILTNDSWFKNSRALNEHNKQAIFRAVENNTYLIRAANTGITSVIDNVGNVEKTIPIMTDGYINAKFNLSASEKSIYNSLGDFIVLVGGIYLVGIFCVINLQVLNKVLK